MEAQSGFEPLDKGFAVPPLNHLGTAPQNPYCTALRAGTLGGMAQIHEYPVTVEWSGGREGNGNCTANTSGAKNNLNVPTEFGGTGGGTNPEELLTSAIASCYSITFGIVAGARRLEYKGITTEATGFVDQPNAATFIFNKVVLKPTITLASGADEAQIKLAEELAHKADNYCIVTNAVRGKVEIVVEPTIVTG